jgi:hypothetical protein
MAHVILRTKDRFNVRRMYCNIKLLGASRREQFYESLLEVMYYLARQAGKCITTQFTSVFTLETENWISLSTSVRVISGPLVICL